MNNEFDLKKALKKAKWIQLLKTAGITLLVLLLIAGGGYWFSQKSLQKTYWKLFNNVMDAQRISSPNTQIDSQTTENGSLFKGEMVTIQSKNINGYIVPWTTISRTYGLFRANFGNERDMVDEYQTDDSHFYLYNRSTKQKVISFFSPHESNYQYKELPNELKQLSTIKDSVAELGISFDKPYTVKEIETRIPKNLTIAWYWTDSYVKKEQIKNPDGYGPTQHLIGLANTAKPTSNKLRQTDLAESLKAAKQLQKNEYTDATRAKFIRDNQKKDVGDVQLAGIVVTGQTKNFASLLEEDFIRASSIGVVVPMVPYIKPDK